VVEAAPYFFRAARSANQGRHQGKCFLDRRETERKLSGELEINR
jgi:hypothetical protein